MRKVKNVSNRQAQALLAEGGWTKDDQLSDPTFQVYVDRANRALSLARFEGGSQLYEDSAEFVRLQEEMRRRQNEPPRHPLEGQLAHDANFIEHVPELIASLPTALGLEALPPLTLDGLVVLEDAIGRVGHSRCQKKDVFSALVAFSGEVMRECTKGSWFGVPARSVVEPWIRGADGREYPVFGIVYKELCRGRRGSIRGAVEGSLKSHLLG